MRSVLHITSDLVLENRDVGISFRNDTQCMCSSTEHEF